ncbi:MAG: HIT family protein, partial [Oligoflexia bacterium]|nr:HIT family protein [Oligoflexia bacterium]
VFFSAVFSAPKPFGNEKQNATGCKRIGSAIIGLEVPHFHLHLVPMNRIGDLNFSNAKEAIADELCEMQNKILGFLK